MDRKKVVEEMLKNYTTNVVIIKNIDIEIETIILCDNPDPKKIDRLNHIKNQKQFEVKRVNNMLEGLKDRDLKIIEMRYFRRYKFKDIAAELDLNCNYVYCLKFKIINKLVDRVFHSKDYLKNMI